MPKKSSSQAITVDQLRAARAALGWSAERLAEVAGLSWRTVARLEASEGLLGGSVSTQSSIKACFEAAGIEFIGAPEEGPGIRYWPERAVKR